MNVSVDRDSLDRFLQTRGAQILGRAVGQSSYKVHGIVGAAITTLGLGFLASPLFGAPVEVMAGSIGPLIAGTINIGMAIAARRRIIQSQPGVVEYSPDAKALLLALHRGLGAGANYYNRMLPIGVLPFAASRMIARRIHLRLALRGTVGTMPTPAVEVVTYLERAAVAYQRVAAVLATSKNQAAIAKLGPRAALAAEEAMSDIFHHSATLCRYPEGLDAGRKPIEAQIKALEEIADGFENLAATSLEPQSINRSNVDDLLTDLRLEQLARSELRPLRSDGGESIRE